MNKSSRKRDILIILGVLIILLVVAGVFLFWPKEEKELEFEKQTEGSLAYFQITSSSPNPAAT